MENQIKSLKQYAAESDANWKDSEVKLEEWIEGDYENQVGWCWFWGFPPPLPLPYLQWSSSIELKKYSKQWVMHVVFSSFLSVTDYKMWWCIGCWVHWVRQKHTWKCDTWEDSFALRNLNTKAWSAAARYIHTCLCFFALTYSRERMVWCNHPGSRHRKGKQEGGDRKTQHNGICGRWCLQ